VLLDVLRCAEHVVTEARGLLNLALNAAPAATEPDRVLSIDAPTNGRSRRPQETA
jgi:hypothetical protein